MTVLPSDPIEHGGIAAFAAAFHAGGVSSESVTRAYLERIEALDGKLGAYQHVAAENAVRTACAMDELRAAGTDLGPLMGVPVAVKDIFAVDGMPTTNGSLLDTAQITGGEGAFVHRLKRAGAVILGKTRTVEFAFGATGVNTVRGTPWNPWDAVVKRVPGGSSSGSGVATAAGLAAFAIGSDTGGSVRIPACFNGLFGHKTTVGLWPTDGVFPLSTTLDTVGPLCRTAADAAIVYSVVTGVDIPTPITLSGLRFGRPIDRFLDDLDEQVAACFEAALAALSEAGVEIVDIELPETGERADLFRDIVPAEFIASLGREFFEREMARMDPISAARAAVGLHVATTDHAAVLRRHRKLKAVAGERFRGFDGWVTPTCPCLPMPVAEVDDPADLSRAVLPSRNTQMANMYGICAITTPIHHFGSVLPVGLQVMCPAEADARALAIGLALEELFGGPAQPELGGFLA